MNRTASSERGLNAPNRRRGLRHSEVIVLLLVGLYLFVACVVFGFLPPLPQGSTSGHQFYRIWADTLTYREYAEAGGRTLVSLGGNYLGPVVLYRALGLNDTLVFLFNIFTFTTIIFMIFKLYRQYFVGLTIFFILNPITFLSLLYLNKELVALLSVLLLGSYLTKNRKLYLFLSLFLALYVRWQQILVVLAFLPLARFYKNEVVRQRLILVMVAIVVTINFLYPSYVGRYVGQFESQAVNDSNITKLLLNLQSHYLFILAYPFKIALNIFGNPISGVKFLRDIPEHRDIYNSGIILMQIMSIFIFATFALGRVRRYTQFMAFGLFYATVFSISPFIQARYFYPILPILYIALLDRSIFKFYVRWRSNRVQSR
ncbi:hypothetical protein [Deinococcus pimensis]|uniref:hypothetical protein n=1 Tax=Deinococcus pimensis TaxID=309888 RepID=UPI0012F83AD9|nr:hypothetical protein [Deinococcus pimensis]